MQLTWKDLKGSLRRKRPPEAPPEPGGTSEPMPDDAALAHLPVETGPVP
jgi:hypothetical protein